MDLFNLKFFDLTRDEYELFFSFSPDLHCIAGPTHFVKVNPAFQSTFGYSPAEMCEVPHTSFVHPDDLIRSEQALEDHMKRGAKVFVFENRFRCKDGSYRLIEWRSMATGDQMYATGRDITDVRASELEAKRAREKAETIAKELESFSHMVAHDLRAPLRSIQSFSTILVEDHSAQLNEDGIKVLGRVITAAKRMAQLIEGLLDLSRINREIVAKKEIDVTQLAEEICEQLQAQDPSRKANFYIQKGMAAKAAPELFRSAVSNLLDNAWKFSKPVAETVIEMGQIEVNGVKKFFIRDNGVGFNKKYSDKLFGVFQRLHSVSEFEGIGMGLATTRRIIERHGGTIQADLSAGKGATFYFTV